jgi:hypothetical protein
VDHDLEEKENAITNIVNDAKEEKIMTPKIICNQLEINNISVHTIRRTLHENKLHGRIANSEYPYTGKQLIRTFIIW